jgi:hypothetical protein
MSENFKTKWKEYTKLWWNKYCPVDISDIFCISTIVLWGVVSYPTYEASTFFKTHPIRLNNRALNIYFYMIEPAESDIYSVYFFANTTDLKSKIMNSYIPQDCLEKMFLLRLYENSVSIYNLFNHKYSINCWEGLMTSKEQKQ